MLQALMPSWPFTWQVVIPILVVAAFCAALLWFEELIRPFLYINTVLDSEDRRNRYKQAMRAWVVAMFVFAVAAIISRGASEVLYVGFAGLAILLLAMNGYVFWGEDDK
jgi:hypothetical protein